MLKKDFIRDGNRKIIGSVTTGYSDSSSIVREDQNHIAGVPMGFSTQLGTAAAS